jgi:hypothetical protein
VAFDVFGHRLVVERVGARRGLYERTGDGKRRWLSDAVHSPQQEAAEVGRELADLFHEWASPSHPHMRQLP